MFFLVSVILLTGGGGLPLCMLGYHPPPIPGADTAPREQTPPSPQSRHPPGADTPQSRDTPLEQTPPCSRHPPWKQTPAYRQWTTGTHPTGMHSFSSNIYESLTSVWVYEGTRIFVQNDEFRTRSFASGVNSAFTRYTILRL